MVKPNLCENLADIKSIKHHMVYKIRYSELHRDAEDAYILNLFGKH